MKRAAGDVSSWTAGRSPAASAMQHGGEHSALGRPAIGEVNSALSTEEGSYRHSTAVEPSGEVSSVGAKHARQQRVVGAPFFPSSAPSAEENWHDDPPVTTLVVADGLSAEQRTSDAEHTASRAAAVRGITIPVMMPGVPTCARRNEHLDAAESAGGATKMIDGLATTTGRAVPDVGVNHAETAADEESLRDTPPGAGMPSTCAEPDSPLMFGSMPILNGRPPKFTERCAYQESLAPGLRYRSMDNSPVSTRSQASPSRRQTHL